MKKINLFTTFSYVLAFFGVVILSFGIYHGIQADNINILARETDAGELEGGLKLLGAGISSIGFIGAGIGQGFAAGKAAEGVSRNPEAEAKIRNMMIVGAAIAETSALYALVMGILLVFVA